MKNIYSIALFICAFLSCQFAGAQASEITAKFHDGQYPAYSTEYHFPSDIVTDAIKLRLKEDKVKVHTRKNVISSEGIHYNVLTPQIIDLYFEVEGIGRKGKDGARVNMFVSNGKDNFTGSTQDPELAQNAVQYLNNLRHYIALYDLNQQIGQQQKSIDKEAKDYKKLLKNARKSESKRYSLQSDLSKETDPGKQDKLQKKIDKLDKDVSRKQRDISSSEQKLQQLKDQLNLLQRQLDQENSRN